MNWFRANPDVSKNEWFPHIRQETRARTVISQRSRAISRPGTSRLTTEYPANGSSGTHDACVENNMVKPHG